MEGARGGPVGAEDAGNAARLATVAMWTLGAVASALVLVLVLVIVLTSTPWGRGQVREVVLGQLEPFVDGELRIERIGGSPLHGIRLRGVTIVDAEGRPFVDAGRISFRYSVPGLLRQRLLLTDVRIEDARVVLDQPPGELWNFTRIFAGDGDAEPADPRAGPGWGSWVELRSLRISGSSVTFRVPWEPDEDLGPAEQDAQRRRALARETRERVMEVSGGYQAVMEYRDMEADVDRILVAHPDSTELTMEVASLAVLAFPFNAPGAEIQDLSGTLRLGQDAVEVEDLRVELPNSSFRADGRITFDLERGRLQLEADPISLGDLRVVRRTLPPEVEGEARMGLVISEEGFRLRAEDMDFRAGEGRFGGDLEVVLGDFLRVEHANVTLDRIPTRLVGRALPELEIPVHGEVSGHLRAAADGADARVGATGGATPGAGAARPMNVDAELEFTDESGRTSRARVHGHAFVPEDPAQVRLQELRVTLDPLQAELVRAFAPGTQVAGVIEADVMLSGSLSGPMHLDGQAVHRDPVAGSSRIVAAGGVSVGAEFAFADMELRLEPVQVELARAQVDRLPPGSTLTGTLRLDGAPTRILRVDGDLWLDDPEGGRSRVVASGGIGGIGGVAADEALVLRAFEVTVAPLQLRSARAFVPADAASGTLVGTARLDGSATHGLAFDVGVVHADGTGSSRLDAAGEIATAGEGRITAVLDAHELSLETVGAFVPEAGLHGEAAGQIRVQGTLASLHVDGAFELPGEAELDLEGTFDVAAEEPAYDLRLAVRELDLATLSARVVDSTRIEGTLAARGRGTDPAHMDATVQADLVDRGPTFPGSFQAEVAVHDAMADFRHLRWSGEASDVEILGTFGLDGSRQGELAYRVAIDSLEVLAPFVAVDEGTVEPRPAVRRVALAEREAAARDAWERARVEYLATGRAPRALVAEPPDTVGADPRLRDAAPPGAGLHRADPLATLGIAGLETRVLAGRVEAAGTLRGNVEHADLEGTLELEDVFAAGHFVRRASAGYTATGLGGDDIRATLDATAEEVLVGGFGYDALTVAGAYEVHGLGGPTPLHRGTASVGMRQDAETRILADLGVEFAGTELELGIETLELDMADAVYSLAMPAMIRWTDAGLEVDAFRLEGVREEAEAPPALVVIDGLLPMGRHGSAPEDGALDVRIEALGLDHVMTLAQARDDVRGRLDLAVPVRGTAARPRFEGELAVIDLHVDDHLLPIARASFAYTGTDFTADATMEDEDGRVMAAIEAMLPVDLALVDAAESRLLPGPIQVQALLHEFRLDGFDALSEMIDDLEGTVVGEVMVAGTFEDPEPRGSLEIDAPSLTVVPTGVRFRDIAGSLSLVGDVMTLDSLVAHSRGPLRVSGTIDVARPAEPAFDLVLTARNSRIMHTEDVQLQADADLTLAGPFDGVVVEGDVRIREGRIRIPETRELAEPGPLDLQDPATFDRVDQLFVEARDALVPPSPFAQALTVALTVHVDRGMWIRSTEANVELFSPPEVGPLTVRMEGLSARDLSIEGTISTDRGEYAFMGRRFEIARGSVTFTGGTVDPIVRLTAEHEVQLPGREAFDIRVIVDGTLQDLETRLESTAQPPLSQTDLISFVVFGRSAGSLLQQSGSSLAGQESSGGPLVGSMAARATQQFATVGMEALLKELETETARALRLDVLHIQPADTPAEVFTGRVADVLRDTEIEAGRYLTTRLYVSGNARPTFVHPGARVEYRTPGGYVWRASWRPQFLPSVPTLAIEEPDRASVLGFFLLREWRF